MAKSRPQPTMADYMAIAISPALIIVLVGSLAFFLLTIFYAGQFEERMYWTTACFVFAAVLISRISIMEGAERASLFGLALGAVAGLAMMRFTDHPWWAWLVLGVIWWCASHLVWNCTLVDDDDDASGEGLLEAAGLDPAVANETAHADADSKTAVPATGEQRKRKKAAPAPPAEPPQSIGRRLFAWWQRSASRKAPPGLTVVYFSLAALPIFGLGQHFVQESDRQYAFNLTVRYVAAALGLLLTTSFLGLRRYLRQRRLEMPVEMAGMWLGAGAALAAAILLVAVLIPRPNPEYAISSLTGTLGSPDRQASSRAVMRDSPGQGESSTTAAANDQTQIKPDEQAQQQGSAQQSGRSQEGGQSPGATNSSQPSGTSPHGQQTTSGASGKSSQEQSSSGQASDSQGGKQQSSSAQSQQQADQQNQQGTQSSGGNKTADQQNKQADAEKQSHQQSSKQAQSSGGQQSENRDQQNSQPGGHSQQQSAAQMAKAMSQHAQPPAPRPPSFSPGQWLMPIFKFLLYAGIVLAGLYCLVRYWAQVKAFLAALWREIVDLWNSLFGRRRSEIAAAEEEQELRRVARRPFSSFADPFLSGAARSNPPAALVQYSFEALEAWAAERDMARAGDETPLEFAARVAREQPQLAEGVQLLASLYARVAYARESLRGESLQGVEQLWAGLRGAAALPLS